MSIRMDKTKLQEALAPYKTFDYPVTFQYLYWANRMRQSRFAPHTEKNYADVAVQSLIGTLPGVTTGNATIMVRATTDRQNWYFFTFQQGATTADHQLWKRVAGSNTTLATDAVDIPQDDVMAKISASGSTINSYWRAWNELPEDYTPPADLGAPKLSVTDTDLTTGRVWFGGYLNCQWVNVTGDNAYHQDIAWIYGWVLPPSSKQPKPIAYFEMPITGKGTFDDPFRVEMPAEIVVKRIAKPIIEGLEPEDIFVAKRRFQLVKQRYEVLKRRGWTEEEIREFMPEVDIILVRKVNRLALTHSVLIPTGKGKPKHGTAIVRIYPSSSAELKSLEERLKAVAEMPKCRKLTREEAIDLALRMDDRLFIHDLVPCLKHPESPDSKCCREYIDWREKTLGVKRELIDENLMARYVKESKW